MSMERLLNASYNNHKRKVCFEGGEHNGGNINSKVSRSGGRTNSLGGQTTSTTTPNLLTGDENQGRREDAALNTSSKEYTIQHNIIGGIRVVSLMDQWIMSRLSHLVEVVNKALEDAELHVATGALKAFFYTEFCDIYVVCIYNLRLLKINYL